MAHILLLNGPNLNLLGTREPAVYGSQTLDQIVAQLTATTNSAGHRLTAFQSNSEPELIARIHAATSDKVGFAIFNPGAFTHTSIALRDALLGAREFSASLLFLRHRGRHYYRPRRPGL
jgi:3-dehydroquinate dehydratase-2